MELWFKSIKKKKMEMKKNGTHDFAESQWVKNVNAVSEKDHRLQNSSNQEEIGMNPSPTTIMSHFLKVEGMQEVLPALHEFDSFPESGRECSEDCNSFGSVSVPIRHKRIKRQLFLSIMNLKEESLELNTQRRKERKWTIEGIEGLGESMNLSGSPGNDIKMLALTQDEKHETELSEFISWIWASEIELDLSLEFTPSQEVGVASKFSSFLVSVTKTSSILLIQQLANGLQTAKTVTAGETRLLAETGKENCAFTAEARYLLSSPNTCAEETLLCPR
ncbi:hypothetical protein VNO77_44633 [Canavalia gladiata]|uniref:Uncharacterized protein n=1 Tax=Canavalia gladiata TaxID=3824 RepID=A0AAN9PQI1_CANGL